MRLCVRSLVGSEHTTGDFGGVEYLHGEQGCQALIIILMLYREGNGGKQKVCLGKERFSDYLS